MRAFIDSHRSFSRSKDGGFNEKRPIHRQLSQMNHAPELVNHDGAEYPQEKPPHDDARIAHTLSELLDRLIP